MIYFYKKYLVLGLLKFKLFTLRDGSWMDGYFNKWIHTLKRVYTCTCVRGLVITNADHLNSAVNWQRSELGTQTRLLTLQLTQEFILICSDVDRVLVGESHCAEEF